MLSGSGHSLPPKLLALARRIMLAVVSSCLGLMPRLPMRSAVASARHALSMSAFVGPRQQEIEAKLTEAFSPLHLQVDNESHGRQEDECALPYPRRLATLARSSQPSELPQVPLQGGCGLRGFCGQAAGGQAPAHQRRALGRERNSGVPQPVDRRSQDARRVGCECGSARQPPVHGR